MTRRRAALLVATLGLLAGGPARAQVQTDLEGSASVGHVRTVPATTSTTRVYVYPSATLHFGSPRLVWRARYLFSGSMTVQGEGEGTYANDLSLSAALQPSTRTTLTLTANLMQGSVFDRVVRQPVAANEPTLRAPDYPAQVSAIFSEALAWEVSRSMSVVQLLHLEANAPQEALEHVSTIGTFSLGLNRGFRRDSFGLTLTPRYAVLRPIGVEVPPREGSALCGGARSQGCVEVRAGSAVLAWNRDLTQSWNVFTTAGAEAVSLVGGGETNVHPTGSLTARYSAGRIFLGLGYTHGAAANLEEGTMSLTDEAILRGGWILDEAPLRQLSASLGFLQGRGLSAAGAASTAGTVATADLGLAWGLFGAWVVNARYSMSLQFGRPGVDGGTVHAVDVGIGWHSNPGMQRGPGVPSAGERVDGGDRVPFPGEARSH